MTPITFFFCGIILTVIAFIATVAVFLVYTGRVRQLPAAVAHEDLTARTKVLRGQLQRLEAERKELTATLAEQDHRKAEANRVIAEADQLKEFLQINKQKASEIEDNIREASRTEQNLTAARQEDDEARHKLSETRQHLETEQRNLEAGRHQVEIIKSELTDLNIKLTSAEDRIERLTKEKNKLDISNETLRAESESLAKQCRELRDNVERLEGHSNELHEVKAVLAVSSGELDHLRAQVDAEKQLHANLLGQTDRVTNLLQPDADTRLQDLYRPYFSLNGDTEPLPVREELQVLGDFARKLDDAGLVFHDRAIRAFHSSLKIADISPLVVLAGISGTGKSLLPNLYARFMGIHFLQISVQPRWDGPQDIFGFYNYVENRYKATELSRVLWQMDRHNNATENGTEQSKIQDGMVLILLDEMNLARVEYYFSDLLSKLETRRNVNPERADDAAERRNAEIEIDSGANAPGEKNVRLFVGSNVLFVGTMNEDETTQTLSDKVIDRANVIRFGKPANPSRHIPTIEELAPVGFLPCATWQRWHRNSLPDGEQETLHGYLQRINNAMVRVGRPFGFRVQHAIELYVANYPGQRPAAFHDAFSDQLELKIIPKLSGLDHSLDEVHSVYRDIEDVIQEILDPALLAAFQRATEREHPFFHWTGVDRSAENS